MHRVADFRSHLLQSFLLFSDGFLRINRPGKDCQILMPSEPLQNLVLVEEFVVTPIRMTINYTSPYYTTAFSLGINPSISSPHAAILIIP